MQGILLRAKFDEKVFVYVPQEKLLMRPKRMGSEVFVSARQLETMAAMIQVGLYTVILEPFEVPSDVVALCLKLAVHEERKVTFEQAQDNFEIKADMGRWLQELYKRSGISDDLL